jgi:hypothetical protein
MKIFLAVEIESARIVLESLESLGVVFVDKPKYSDIAVIDSNAIAFAMDAISRVGNQCLFVIGHDGRVPNIFYLQNEEYHWHDRLYILPFSGRRDGICVADFLLQKLAE